MIEICLSVPGLFPMAYCLLNQSVLSKHHWLHVLRCNNIRLCGSMYVCVFLILLHTHIRTLTLTLDLGHCERYSDDQEWSLPFSTSSPECMLYRCHFNRSEFVCPGGFYFHSPSDYRWWGFVFHTTVDIHIFFDINLYLEPLQSFKASLHFVAIELLRSLISAGY